ncbi:hypothetical protein BDZ94DRAFT_1368680 [Collybia nuda]|uniref:Uncharacterized protein n=1 Tax=Collybia nuda TaxID=64659 RepID=A0A9P5Y6H9_9AGAR|nr:hypothetical protein BDZ94DRAFT_1368680 [Collybia nuda]
MGDVKTEYHPHSQIGTKMQSFEEYISSCPPPVEPDIEPWLPFKSRLDFEIAEVMLEAALNRSQKDRLIKLIHRAVENSPHDPFTLENGKGLDDMWDSASVLRTNFKKKTFTVPYKDEDWAFDLHMRDPWEWAVDILTDPMLGPHLVWNAQILQSWNGDKWERFFTEPWTAKLWWDIQNNLPNSSDAKVLAFIIYADKTKLSSFGTAKGYPIVARCGNLPHHIRNTDGRGGGRVVGWLPIVHEDTAETGKPGFVNFKNAVWHAAFEIFIGTVAQHSKTGCWIKCGDNIMRWLWPTILILSADYEEMTVMSLTRGVRASFPCPICLVHQDELADLSKTHKLRTQEQSKVDFGQADAMRRMEDKEKFLKDRGLRYVKNSMWEVGNMDLHRALSYDTLHFDDNGLWEDHYFKLFKSIIHTRVDIARIDQRFKNMSRWRGLNHFDSVMNISFNDGSKNHDISKIFLFAAHDLLLKDTNQAGYLLLQCLRSYLNIRMYADFDLHTEETIYAGQELADIVSEGGENEEFISQTKNWNFPKIHLRQHLFDNIEDKGVSRNSSTKPNESMHGPLRKSYLGRSNFKNPAEQILKADHHLMVSGLIRSNINALDKYLENSQPDPEDQYTTTFPLGSQEKPCSFLDLEKAHQGDPAFKDFRIKLGKFLTGFLPLYDIQIPGGQVKFHPGDLITEYHYLKVKYNCLSDWKIKTNYLRCNKNFHGHSRYDCVLIKSASPYFARLVCLISCQVNGKEHSVALVQPYELNPTRNLSQAQRDTDRDLELIRLRENFRSQCEFISIHSIVRGVVLVYSDEKTSYGTASADYFLFDLLDQDIFLHGREWLEQRTNGGET